MNEIQPFAAPLRTFAYQMGSPLSDQMLNSLERLIAGEFSRIVALLPAWLSDIIPVAADVAFRLGLANLYLWWYYEIQDGILDRALPPDALLTAHLALIEALTIYHHLGVAQAPCWSIFQDLIQRAARSNAIEFQTRFPRLQELTLEQPTPLSVEFLADRAAPLVFFVVAQAHLAGLAPADPRPIAICAALRAFASARQIGDDAADWLTDLRAGQLNYVSAQLITAYQAVHQTSADLDMERLVGFHVTAESCWEAIEQTASNALQQALDLVAPYHAYHVQRLINQQQTVNQHAWEVLRQQRNAYRMVFFM